VSDQHESVGQDPEAVGSPTPPVGSPPPPPAPSSAAGTFGSAWPTGPAQSKPSPFAGVPVADYVVDAVAAVLLFISLALPWNFTNTAAERIDVVLITILSVLSLSVHYLARLGLFPSTWTVKTTRMARALANAPYAVLVLVYLVRDVVASGNPASSGYSGGLGGAVALGLAGAILAAAPRVSELGRPEDERNVILGWMRVVEVLLGVIWVAQLLSLIIGPVSGRWGSFTGVEVVLAVLLTMTVAAVAGWMVVGVIRRDAAWRLVAITTGAVVVVFFVFVFLSSSYGIQFHGALATGYIGGVGLVFIPAAAAAVAGPAIAQSMARRSPHLTWFQSASHAADYIILLGAVTAVTVVLELVQGVQGFRLVLLLIFALISSVAALVARTALKNDPATGRSIALAAAGVVALLGLVVIVLPRGGYSTPVPYVHLLMAFGMPALIVFALTVPESVSSYLAQRTPAARVSAAPVPSLPAPQAPAAIVPAVERAPQSAQDHGFTAEQAANPATDPAVLSRIATEAPGLRPYLAWNPSTYPALLDWLASLNDPVVTAALQARGR